MYCWLIVYRGRDGAVGCSAAQNYAIHYAHTEQDVRDYYARVLPNLVILSVALREPPIASQY